MKFPFAGRNDNNMNSAWEVGEASNAKEATETDWGASAPSTRRDSASWPSAGQYATGFGPHGDYSRGWNSSKLINLKMQSMTYLLCVVQEFFNLC